MPDLELISSHQSTANRPWLLGLLIAIAILSIAVVFLMGPNALNPEQFAAMVLQAGGWGPVLYMVVIMVSVVVSQIPGAPLAIAAGAVWDPLLAGAYTVIGGFAGALIAYSLGRQIGPPIVQALTGKSVRFSADYGECYIGSLIFLTRLLPIFSFDLVSYGAGIMKVSLPVYTGTTFFGMVPSTLLLTYMGDSLHLSLWSTIALGGVFLSLFIGIPTVMHRYNWLNLQAVVQWDVEA